MAEADFDLLAASLRADAGDVKAFVEALAAKLEGAFPERTRIERGGFFGNKRVRRIAVDLGEESFELHHDRGRIECLRRTVVRGIALKSEEVELDAWIDALSARLVAEAGRTERGRAALSRMLEA